MTLFQRGPHGRHNARHPGTGGDVLLLKIPGICLTVAQLAALRAELRRERHDVLVEGYAAVDDAQTYVYRRVPSGDAEATLASMRECALRARPDAAVQRLRRLCDLPGASHGRAAPWHYIVETDVLPQAEQDLNDWYDQEHLPGLAGVRVRCGRNVSCATGRAALSRLL